MGRIPTGTSLSPLGFGRMLRRTKIRKKEEEEEELDHHKEKNTLGTRINEDFEKEGNILKGK